MDVSKTPDSNQGNRVSFLRDKSARNQKLDLYSGKLEKAVAPMVTQVLKIENLAGLFFAVLGVMLSYIFVIPAIIDLGLWINKLQSQTGMQAISLVRDKNQAAFSIKVAKDQDLSETKVSPPTFEVEKKNRDSFSDKDVTELMNSWERKANQKYQKAAKLFPESDYNSRDRFKEISYMAGYMTHQIARNKRSLSYQSAPFDQFVLCKKDGKVQSVACYDSKTGEIAIIITNPSNNHHPINKTCRVKGAATALILDLVYQRDPDEVILDATYSAVPFYKHIGFVNNQERKPRERGEIAMTITASKVNKVVLGIV